MIRVADYIMQKLSDIGIKHVFYVPGGQCVYLTDALRRSKDIEPVAMHHEQSAAMAALTYSLCSDAGMGACLVTTGCAGTNTMTGILHAWQDSIPCIVISGQQNYNLTVKASGLPLRQVGVQEADIETIVKPITKYAVTLERELDIAYELEKALYCARSGRPGPVWLDVPLNIQNAMVDENNLKHFEEPVIQSDISEKDLDAVMDRLSKAERPIILAGHGVFSAHAKEQLSEFVLKNRVPVTFTRYSSDLMPFDCEYNMGVVSGLAGASRYGNFAIQNSDFVLAIGCRLSVDTTGSDYEAFARAADIYVVDIDEVEHSKKGVGIDRFIHADARAFLERLNQCKPCEEKDAWLETCKHWKEIFMHQCEGTEDDQRLDSKYMMLRISEVMPECSVVLTDAGFTGASAPALTKNREGDRIIHSFSQGEMGYSLPGACGAAVLSDHTVIAYTGDGSFMMNLQELQTVVRNHFNIKIMIMNNNGYSGVRHGQKAHFRGKSIGTDPSNGIDFPEYERIANAFGIAYCRISKYSEIDSCLSKVFASKEPFICEIMTDPEQFDLHNGLVTYGKRKYGFRPIEDQSPFIDRELFFREMIVEPLETSYGKPV